MKASTKYLNRKCHFIRQIVEDEEIEVLHIPSEKMKADHLTKTVDAVKLKNCISGKACVSSNRGLILTALACSLDYKATLPQVQNPMGIFKEMACYRSSPLTRKPPCPSYGLHTPRELLNPDEKNPSVRCQEPLSDGGRPVRLGSLEMTR
ncbi:hypothetical protein LAZ67_23001150 [Cordylochernes scorpioides]|uniref:Uncharacterized protein n=1 Tax=Cordylochernes scorpioides TaxID=51811 RepID=A0ABY6LTK6_9ARAC|nr:hypothetical protein LAZ67_23001150 [Cordylochernes scorpioides]